MDDPQNRPETVQDGVVVSLDYTLRLDDGEVADSSSGDEPLRFVQGSGQIIPGLERELYGMQEGEEKRVVVSAAEAYGELDAEAYQEVHTSFFPQDMELRPGLQISVQDQDSNVYQAYIAEVSGENVVLNFNHPLAGQRLTFDVRVTGLRQASEEELAHGHVHEDEMEGEEWEELGDEVEDE